jgi:adenosylhomocysteine nucleosidase
LKLMIMATFIEARPFIELTPFTRLDQTLFPAFQHEDMILVISGMGKVNAAMALTYGLINFRPDYVLNAGAAGATTLSTSLGDVYQIDSAIEYDGINFKTGKPPVYTPAIISGFQTATIATQDIPVIEKKYREIVSFSAALVDMEASAIIQVCKMFQVRCHVFKFVSDTPDHPYEGSIRKHIRQYRLPFYQFMAGSVLPVLNAFSGNSK